jgi:rRNA maturation endonuclease Nob1
MRYFAIAALFAFASATVAADKPEETAKNAAIAFLKAIKSKDVDAVMKLSDVPFVYKDSGIMVHKEADALKKWLKERLDELKDPEKVPTTIDEMMPFATVKEKIKDASEKELAEEVMGKDGFLAVLATDDGKKVGIAVRLKDGKAKIVGLIR